MNMKYEATFLLEFQAHDPCLWLFIKTRLPSHELYEFLIFFEEEGTCSVFS